MATKAHSFMPARMGAELVAAEHNYTSDSDDDPLEYEAQGLRYHNTPVSPKCIQNLFYSICLCRLLVITRKN